MQRLEVSGAVRLIYKSLGVKGLIIQENPLFPHIVASVCLAQRWKYNPQQLFSYIALTVFFIVEAVCAPRVAD